LVIKTLDPCLDPDLLEMQDSDPYPDSFHESRSTTLEQSISESVGLILYLLIIIYRGGITVITIRYGSCFFVKLWSNLLLCCRYISREDGRDAAPNGSAEEGPGLPPRQKPQLYRCRTGRRQGTVIFKLKTGLADPN
jgi:hypothetical protein